MNLRITILSTKLCVSILLFVFKFVYDFGLIVQRGHTIKGKSVDVKKALNKNDMQQGGGPMGGGPMGGGHMGRGGPRGGGRGGRAGNMQGKHSCFL